MISDRIRLLDDPRENESLIEEVREMASRYPFDQVHLEVVPERTGYRTLRIVPEFAGRSVSVSVMLRPDAGAKRILCLIEKHLERWKVLADENFLSSLGPKPGGKILEKVGFNRLKN